MSDALAVRLAGNIRQLREARGLTQDQMARLAGIPRATWGHLESGAGNPTLSVLHKVAVALQVPLEELTSAPRAISRLYPKESLAEHKQGDGAHPQAAARPDPGRRDRPHGDPARRAHPRRAAHAGHARVPDLRVGRDRCSRWRGSSRALAPGDVVVFRGDQRHSYRNPGKRAPSATRWCCWRRGSSRVSPRV